MPIITEPGLAIGSQLIQHFEGQVLHPYQDIRGIWTIGNGNTTLLDGTPVAADTAPITAEQCDELRERTLREKVAPALNAMLTTVLSDHEQGALLSLVWNIGNTAFRTSTLRAMINLHFLVSAGRHFVDWCHAGGNLCVPLLNRRRAEQVVWNTGDVAGAIVPALHEIMQTKAAPASAAPAAPAAQTADDLNSAELAHIQEGV
jgi:lysozyme